MATLGFWSGHSIFDVLCPPQGLATLMIILTVKPHCKDTLTNDNKDYGNNTITKNDCINSKINNNNTNNNNYSNIDIMMLLIITIILIMILI